MIHLDTITALHVPTGTTKKIRTCSRVTGFNTSPSETPPNAIWDPATREPMHMVRGMFGGGGAGVIDVENSDGWLDAYSDPSEWSFSGQPYEVLSGFPGEPIADFKTSFTGILADPEFNRERVTFNCYDMTELLNRSLPIPKYLGTNVGPSGLEGSEDMEGKFRLLALGPCPNITPRCVNTSREIYSAHFRSCQGIPAVYIDGAPQIFDGDDATPEALDAATIASGHYRSCKAHGLFRLNTSLGRKVTCDVLGDNVGGYVETTAGIARRILEILAEVDGLLSWSEDDLDALEAANNAVVCLFDDSGAKVSALLEDLFEGPWVWMNPDCLGVLRFGRVEAPDASPTESWHDDQSMEADQLASDDITGPPLGLLSMDYATNWTPMRDAEVPGVVTDERRAWLAEEFRTVTSTSDGQPDPAVLAKWPYAPSETVKSRFVNKADAESEVARRVAFRAAGYRPFRVRRAWESVRTMELGESRKLYSGRLMLNGLPVKVSKIEAITSANEAEIYCYG
ncbi:MAG: hypothetical protein ACLGSA_12475 [Acidobacteriota bacterium]